MFPVGMQQNDRTACADRLQKSGMKGVRIRCAGGITSNPRTARWNCWQSSMRSIAKAKQAS